MTLSPDQFHPNVDHYRDGGIGGVGEDHSVVGMVPTQHLAAIREWDRRGAGANPDSGRVIDSLRADLRSGKGFTSPVMVEYDHQNNWAYLGEGNHRVQAALEEGVPHVPTRVVRSGFGPAQRKAEGIGGHIEHTEIPGAPRGYFPSDVHPKYLFGEHGERAPLSASQFKQNQVDDIMGMLRQPSRADLLRRLDERQ